MALNTVDIPGVEIFAVGTHNGQKYTDADLDEIVRAFQELRNGGNGGYSPPIKLDHNDGQPIFDDVPDGGPAFGWVDNLRRVGEKLVADFRAVPAKLKELIDAGAYRGRSAEIWWNLEVDGKKYARALKAVALLGVNMPAVRSLKDIAKLYEGQPTFEYDQEKGAGVQTVFSYEDHGMDGMMTKMRKVMDGMMEMMGMMGGMKGKGNMPEGQPVGGRTVRKKNMNMEEEMSEDTVTTQEFAELKASYEARFSELKGKVETLTTENKALGEANVALNKRQMERWVSDTVREWSGDVESNRKRLTSFAEKFGQDSEEVREYIAHEDASAKVLKASGLFTERGSAERGHATEEDAFEAEVKKYTDTGKARVEAIRRVAQEQPALYAARGAAIRDS